MRALGVKRVVFRGDRGGFRRCTEKLRREQVAILERDRPAIVFSFDPANRSFERLNLFLRDHRVIAEAAFEACFAARNRHLYAGPPHRAGQLVVPRRGEPGGANGCAR